MKRELKVTSALIDIRPLDVTLLNTATDSAEICRLVVHPEAFRRGIASRLLQHVLTRNESKTWTVTTGSKNTPAIRLYQNHQFKYTGGILIDNVLLTQLRRSQTGLR